MSYQILIERRAQREIVRLPLTAIPRVHVGDYRILYEINDRAHEVCVYAVGDRREVYR